MAAKVEAIKPFHKAVFDVDITYNKNYSHSEVVSSCFTLVIKTRFIFV